MKTPRMRLDQLLVERGLAGSREKAKALGLGPVTALVLGPADVSSLGGHGAIAFRQDRGITPRFVAWLTAALKAPATPAIRPRAPRTG